MGNIKIALEKPFLDFLFNSIGSCICLVKRQIIFLSVKTLMVLAIWSLDLFIPLTNNLFDKSFSEPIKRVPAWPM